MVSQAKCRLPRLGYAQRDNASILSPYRPPIAVTAGFFGTSSCELGFVTILVLQAIPSQDKCVKSSIRSPILVQSGSETLWCSTVNLCVTEMPRSSLDIDELKSL